MSALEIRLLGQPEIRVNGTPVRGLPAKLEALLYYLAISPRSVPRGTLAGLLWGDRSEQDARMNLRAALQKVPPELAPHLVITRDWLALDRNREMDVDVQRFDHAVGALSAAPEGPARKLERLAEVAALYRDDFLAGFVSGHAPEFDSWCTAERTRLRQGAVRLLGETLKLRRESGRDDDVIEDARRILQLALGHDAALRELMEALARSGQRNAAVEEYERHRKLWREELGIAPSEETVRLAERIVAGEPPGAPAGGPPPQLIGREREFVLVSRLLTSGEARIVTVTGMGGIGKSQLAQALMAELKPRFGDGTALFSVGAMRSGRALAPSMAAAFGLQLQGRGTMAKLLQDYLREKALLLVFDSFEPVIGTEAVDLLVELAQSSPGVRFLVTSRESLGVAEEAVVALDGLTLPEDDGKWRESPAVQLFVQRATRGYVQFDAERERVGILRICRRVEGVPLALELAAALARTSPCAEIARAIERDLGALDRDDVRLSPRHRSLVGVLACSFSQLSPELQAVLARLASFRGAFTADAAERVAECSLRLLSSLVEKSWLRRDARAGYSLHDMVRQFALGRRGVVGVEAREAARRHATYFLEFIGANRVALRQGGNPALLDEVQAAIADVLEACDWGLANAPDARLEAALEALFRYYSTRGDFASVEACLGPAVERLAAQRRGARRASLAGALSCLGWAQAQTAQYDASLPSLERAVELARSGGYLRIQAEAQRGIALARVLQGDAAGVGGLLEECLAIAHEAGDEFGEAATLILMGIAASYLGSGRGQHDYYERALELGRRLGFASVVQIASFNLGDAHLSAGELERSEACLRESLEYARRAGGRRQVTMCLANLAAIALARGDVAGSRRLVDEAYAIARGLGDRRSFSFLFQAYAELEIPTANWQGVLDWADRMVTTADEIGWGWSAAFGVTLRAQAFTEQGRSDAALAAVLDLHRRVEATDFGVHHANVALEASRWLLRFAPGSADAPLARSALHALAGPLVIDEWVRQRAVACSLERGLGEGDAFDGDERALMDAMARAIGPA